MYIIASFKSRLESIMLKKELDRRGFFAEVVSTPKEANIGCGLSVKINPYHLNSIKRIILTEGFKSFVGFFKVAVTKNGNKVSII
ncbi:MAG: DUF3343 domain-containing protein [Clostridiales bacterium]|nr:DUF3343 domain-containing protein [Clostridiales bacterium]